MVDVLRLHRQARLHPTARPRVSVRPHAHRALSHRRTVRARTTTTCLPRPSTSSFQIWRTCICRARALTWAAQQPGLPPQVLTTLTAVVMVVVVDTLRSDDLLHLCILLPLRNPCHHSPCRMLHIPPRHIRRHRRITHRLLMARRKFRSVGLRPCSTAHHLYMVMCRRQAQYRMVCPRDTPWHQCMVVGPQRMRQMVE